MKIINKTKNTILAQDATVADTFFSRARGLLGRKELGRQEALILKPCNSIHTFFMRLPIDALFVDKNNCIIGVVNNLMPFRLTRIYWQARFVIELSAKAAESALTETGDIVNLE